MRFRDFAAKKHTAPAAGPPVRIEPAPPGSRTAALCEAEAEGIDLAEWAHAARPRIGELLRESGAVLFRGFAIADAAGFERVVRAISETGALMDYVENTSPRTTVHRNVKTSTDHPADQEIVQHNEHSFSSIFPSKLFLHCRTAPASGGATPLADGRRIAARLPRTLRDGFARKGGYLYVRNFGDGFGPEWPAVFQTTDREVLERYLAAHDIGFTWRGADRLRIWYRRPVEVRHPATAETVWFNHVLFWHVSSLAPGVREVLERSFDEQDLPNQSFYGDGSSIEPDVIDTLRHVYAEETWDTPWREQDLLLVDNVLLSHGRRSYTGTRLVLFAMADPLTHADVALPVSASAF